MQIASPPPPDPIYWIKLDNLFSCTFFSQAVPATFQWFLLGKKALQNSAGLTLRKSNLILPSWCVIGSCACFMN